MRVVALALVAACAPARAPAPLSSRAPAQAEASCPGTPGVVIATSNTTAFVHDLCAATTTALARLAPPNRLDAITVKLSGVSVAGRRLTCEAEMAVAVDGRVSRGSGATYRDLRSDGDRDLLAADCVDLLIADLVAYHARQVAPAP